MTCRGVTQLKHVKLVFCDFSGNDLMKEAAQKVLESSLRTISFMISLIITQT